MISLGAAKDALSKLTPPAPDAAFLKTSMDLAQKGEMFQNPMASSFSAIDGLKLDSMATTLKNIPGCANIAAQCTKVTANASAMKGVSGQMFTSVLPTKIPVPEELFSMSPSLTSADKLKIMDFGLPSITDVMSTAQTEQDDNERMGTSGDNPCLPVQKTMENAMKAARQMSSGIDSVKNDVQDGLKKIQSAYAELQTATGSAIATAQAALDAAIGSVTTAINKVDSVVADAGKALVDSIKTVRDSAEKSLQLATASMAKNLIKSNPCMKSVLSPGTGAGKAGTIGVYEYTAKFKFQNKPDADMAIWLANKNNIKVVSYMSSLGFETMEDNIVIESSTSTVTTVSGTITYTIDIDKAKTELVNLEPPLKPDANGDLVDAGKLFSSSAFVKFFNNNGEEVSRIYAKLNLANANTAPELKFYRDENGTKNDSLILVSPVDWTGGKKPSLLSPTMQQISQTAEEVAVTDLKVTEVPTVVVTKEQVIEKEKQEIAEEKASMEQPAVKNDATELVRPEPITNKPVLKPFKKSVVMTKVTTPKNSKWKDAHSVSFENLSGKGGFMITIDQFTSKGLSPPELSYEYEMDSWYIDQLIAEIMAKSNSGIGGSMYHQAIKITYRKKDGSLFGYSTMSFHMNYHAASNQVSFETSYNAGDDENEFVWDSIVFKNDGGLPDEVIDEKPAIINPATPIIPPTTTPTPTPTYNKTLTGPNAPAVNVATTYTVTSNPNEQVSVAIRWGSNPGTAVPVTTNSQGSGSFSFTFTLYGSWNMIATYADGSTKTLAVAVPTQDTGPTLPDPIVPRDGSHSELVSIAGEPGRAAFRITNFQNSSYTWTAEALNGGITLTGDGSSHGDKIFTEFSVQIENRGPQKLTLIINNKYTLTRNI